MRTVRIGRRRLAYEEWGDPAGQPVLFHHGTGDSRLARGPGEVAGIRLVTVDRPGVGGSTPRPGRTLLDWADDARLLVDTLGWHRFAVAGWSGGAPHALAVAHALGDRVSAVTLASPLIPFDRPGAFDLVRDRELRAIWRLRHARWLARLIARGQAAWAGRDLGRFVRSIARSAPADAPVLTDPGLRPMFEAEMGAALAHHGTGVLDDMWAFLDWGFDPGSVGQPVTVLHGVDDPVLSPRMGRWLVDRLPAGWLELVTGGHYTVFAHWPRFLAAVRPS